MSSFGRVVRGALESEDFDFSYRKRMADGQDAPLAQYCFDGVTAANTRFDLSTGQLFVQDSRFVRCSFQQRRQPASEGIWGQGSLGHGRATYEDCLFEGVRFALRAGFSVGSARFERCQFVRCRFLEHLSFCVDYVGCRFEGRIGSAVFYAGEAPVTGSCVGKTNELIDNDFSKAIFKDVAFRGPFAVERQRWADDFDPTPLLDR